MQWRKEGKKRGVRGGGVMVLVVDGGQRCRYNIFIHICYRLIYTQIFIWWRIRYTHINIICMENNVYVCIYTYMHTYIYTYGYVFNTSRRVMISTRLSRVSKFVQCVAVCCERVWAYVNVCGKRVSKFLSPHRLCLYYITVQTCGLRIHFRTTRCSTQQHTAH